MKNYKKIFIYFTIIVISIISCKSVNAEECKNDEYVQGNKYGAYLDENTHVLSLNPKGSSDTVTAGLRNVVFTVYVNNKEVGTVSYSAPLTLTPDYEDDGEMNVLMSASVTNPSNNCTGNVNIRLVETNYPDVPDEEYDLGELPDIDDGKESLKNTIECTNDGHSKTNPGNSFEEAFCEAKIAAQKADPNGNKKLNFTDKFNNNKTFSDLLKYDNAALLKCDSTKICTSENYYVNKSYLYGSGTNNMNFGTYTYHYTPGSSTKGDTVECKVKCEEAVTVEYGPPVAAKAAFCFEYKVKVTSRVSCNMIEKPKKPKHKYKVCTPKPRCTGTSLTGRSYRLPEGGPDEDFDSCVIDCDGGKYTDKCVNKCYSDIYEDEEDIKKTNLELIDDLYATKVSSACDSCEVKNGKIDCTCMITPQYDSNDFSLSACKKDSRNDGGCYTRSSNGTIKWKPSKTQGRWYKHHHHKNYSEYVPRNGIMRHKYSDGSICHDSCKWIGCSDKTKYLNYGFAEKDYKNNKAIYDAAVSKCKASASCTTTTAEFSISVDYSYKTKENGNKVTKNQTIYFPYTSFENKTKTFDKLTSKGNSTDESNDSASKPNSTILSYEGCYKSGERKNWYQTEWSFPGTWTNIKTSEITYENKDAASGWKKFKNKFCMPLNAQDVNQEWWNYYHKNIVSCPGDETPIDSVKSQEYKDLCETKGNKEKSITGNPKPEVKKWNIHADAQKFGYFEWTIKIDCFYGLNSNPAMIPSNAPKDTKDSCITTGPENYRIRSVDLENMFPAADGSSIQGSDQYGRAVGYNWSVYSTNQKNLEYKNLPHEYVNEIQQLGYSVYDDNYLDYEFDLTPDLLSKLKNDSNAKDYTKFTGETKIATSGITIYKSDLYRGNGVLNSVSKKPPEAALKCNNYINYSSSACKQ